MTPRRWIGLYALLVLAAMTWVSWHASTAPTITSLPQYAHLAGKSGVNVLDGFVTVCSEPWGLATMFDAYFGFLAFWLYVAWRESRWSARAGWLVGLLLLGNFAIAGYALACLWRTPATATIGEAFFTRRAA